MDHRLVLNNNFSASEEISHIYRTRTFTAAITGAISCSYP